MKMVKNGPMLNAYPDSLGGTLGDIVEFLERPELKNVFSSFYILPSLFHTDLDRGFSVIDYSLNELLAKQKDLDRLQALGIDLKLDFILNHASVLSEQFQDILKKGEKSEYLDFFIDWNKFWQGHGRMTKSGYIEPDSDMIKDMFFRKPGLPILMVRFPDGTRVPYWNTFYQEIRYPAFDVQDIHKLTGVQYGTARKIAEIICDNLQMGKTPEEIMDGLNDVKERLSKGQKERICETLEANRKYLGQMDLNIRSPLVWDFYKRTLSTLRGYGAKIIRLDAFAYAPKEPGARNFLNEPGTWELLDRIRRLADQYKVELLPEIHAGYGEKVYEKIAQRGYMVYDFFLPGLMIDAFEQKSGEMLKKWADEIMSKKIHTVNMLGCHDGIPVLDLKGMLPEERISQIIHTIVQRGGYVKDLHGQKNVYYQVNATYYSALGENDDRMLLARAIQLFMPGKPQVWYLDLFIGKNDQEAVKKAGAGGHKEINRTNLATEDINAGLKKQIVRKQLELLKFRNAFPAFSFESEFIMKSENPHIYIEWRKADSIAILEADLDTLAFTVTGQTGATIVYRMGN